MIELENIDGVGPKTKELLNKLKINNGEDLLYYYPYRYDVIKRTDMNILNDGDKIVIDGIVEGQPTVIFINKSLKKLIFRINTKTMIINITVYNKVYLHQELKCGKEVTIIGKYHKLKNTIVASDVRFGLLPPGAKIEPIYYTTEGLTIKQISKFVSYVLNNEEYHVHSLIPTYLEDKYNLLSKKDAIYNVHIPEDIVTLKKARQRIKYEELFMYMLKIRYLKQKIESDDTAIERVLDYDKINKFIDNLPYKLTLDQSSSIKEILKDLESKKRMNRLLQGDVGSGKTVVAMIAAYKAVKSGYQATIMAPTAILASQHLESFKGILDELGIRTELLISNVTKKKKAEILEKLQSGEIDVLIGTHAILEENVVFKNLGLVVTDEQHRFGVKQRSTIAAKGQNPDIIAMSATPIPRTLALILYGDLDISIIDELPPNRKKIETFAVRKNMEERVNNFIKKQIAEGRQAYIVCPLVEENEDMEGLQSVVELAEKYQKETFSEYKVAYLHGKMKPKEKDEIMQRFKDGEIQILIATTVIEVGVNVPNASIMVVENAERFGLAQLHQLRGRVGRGEYQSYCILKYEGNGETIRQRMKVMCDTNDGFIISEKDLELRGSGDFFGTEQHGLPEFKIANLFEDMAVLKKVQGLALKIMEDDPLLEKEKNAKLNDLVKEKFSSRIEI